MDVKRRRLGLKALVATTAALMALVAVGSIPVLAGAPDVEVFDPEGPFSKYVDVGPTGFSHGDVIVEVHPLLDPGDGSKVGQIFTHVSVIKVYGGGDDVALVVNCTLKLAGGNLAFTGAARLSQLEGSGAVVPVTGGTGIYAGASGTVTMTHSRLDGDPGTTLSFDLI